MSQTPPAAETPPRKTLIAAGLLLAMFAISGSLAVYSGYLLWRGEDAGAVMKALPSGCQEVLFVDKPAEAGAVAEMARANRVASADEITATAQFAAADAAGTASEPWALCSDGVRPAWYGALADPRLAQSSQLAIGWANNVAAAHGWGSKPLAWSVEHERQIARTADGQVAAAVDIRGQVARAVWLTTAATPTADSGAVLALLSALQQAALARPLQKDELFRASLERTGGGQVHWFHRGSPVSKLTKRGVELDADGSAMLSQVDWNGAALLHEGERLIVHEHLGGGQRLAGWLKQRFDISAGFDAANVLPASAVAGMWGVDRFHHQGAPVLWFNSLSGVYHWMLPSNGLPDDRRWAQLLTGNSVWFMRGLCTTIIAQLADPQLAQLPALPAAHWAPCNETKLVKGYLVRGSAEGVAEAVRAITDPTLAASAGSLDVASKRLLGETQGYHEGGKRQFRLEWAWVDSGLVIERDYPAKP